MSTKIFNGYRLAEGTNPFEFTRRVRELIDPIRDELDGAMLARLSSNAVDSCWLRGEPVPSMLAFTTLMKWDEEQQKLNDESRQKNPHRFELCIGEDPDSGRTLVRLYTDKKAMQEAFEAMDEVESYSYWNNADEPEGVSIEEWNERSAAWERVMPGYAPPAETMLTFILRTRANPRTMMLCNFQRGVDNPVLRNIPDRADRALQVARTRYLHQLVGEHGIDEIAALRHSLTDRIKEKLQSIASIVEPHLWEITPDLLSDGDPELTRNGEVLDTLDIACGVLFEEEKDALKR